MIQNQLIRSFKQDRRRIRCKVDPIKRRFKKSILQAEKRRAKLAIVIGETELKTKKATVRDMRTKNEDTIDFDMIVEKVKERLSPHSQKRQRESR